MKETEKKPTRSARRYVLALPVQLACGSGLTRDVSAGGVYLLTDQAYPLDSQLALTLLFDAMLPQPPLQVQCRAPLVRVEARRAAAVSPHSRWAFAGGGLSSAPLYFRSPYCCS